jgi:hypothetical protein
MSAAFPQDALTGLLSSLSQDTRFSAIYALRNPLAHRITGRRSAASSETVNKDGTYTTDFHKEAWHIPGASGNLTFGKDMLQRHLIGITDLLSSLATAAQTFAESHQPKPSP